MIIITSVIICIFIVSVIWIWHNLGNIERPKKIAFILIGILIIYVFTLILYNIASTNISYPNEEMQKTVSDTLILVFTSLNVLIFLPFIANVFDKILEEEIEKKQAQKRILILAIIFIICIVVENGYIKSTQEGIINRIISINDEVQNAEK